MPTPSSDAQKGRHHVHRRAVTRHDCAVEATMIALDGSGVSVKASIVNVGEGGAMVRTHADVLPGQRWCLALTLPDGSRHTACTIVRRVRAHEGSRLAGLQFTLDPSILLAIGVRCESLREDSQLLRSATPPSWSRSRGVQVAHPVRVKSLIASCLHSTADLTIDELCIDSDLDVQGQVIADSACIIGGTTHALSRISVAELGSPDVRRTIVVLGRSEIMHTMIHAAECAISRLREQADGGAKRLAEMSDQQAEALSAADREAIMIMRFDREAAETQIARIEHNSSIVRQRENALRTCELRVGRAIYPGVELTAGQHTARFTTTVQGPLIVTLGASGDLVLAPEGDGRAAIAPTEVATVTRAAA